MSELVLGASKSITKLVVCLLGDMDIGECNFKLKKGAWVDQTH